MIKSVSASDNEIPIARLLSRRELQDDPANHCIPILDVVNDPLEPAKAMMIMPYLRPFDDPDFRTIGEVVDFISQTLEVRFQSFRGTFTPDEDIQPRVLYSFTNSVLPIGSSCNILLYFSI